MPALLIMPCLPLGARVEGVEWWQNQGKLREERAERTGGAAPLLHLASVSPRVECISGQLSHCSHREGKQPTGMLSLRAASVCLTWNRASSGHIPHLSTPEPDPAPLTPAAPLVRCRTLTHAPSSFSPLHLCSHWSPAWNASPALVLSALPA